jgi:hypothetical protein
VKCELPCATTTIEAKRFGTWQFPDRVTDVIAAVLYEIREELGAR